MKLTTGILAVVMMTVAAWGQNPDASGNARSGAKSPQQIKASGTNAALDTTASAKSAKPAPGAPAPAVKPASIPGAKATVAAVTPASSPVAKSVAASAPKIPAASTQNNTLQRVNVVRNADDV